MSRYVTFGEGRQDGTFVENVNGIAVAVPRPEWYSEEHCLGCWFYAGIVTNRTINVNERVLYSLKDEDRILFDHCKMFGGCKKNWHWQRERKYSKHFVKIPNQNENIS